MNLRNYQSGDEASQVQVYNTAASALPKFKPTTVPEVSRRVRSADFDPSSVVFVEDAGQIIGYCKHLQDGRVSYPWVLPGHEECAVPLFNAVIGTMRRKGLKLAYAAYRHDWQAINTFFAKMGFAKAREMINFLSDFENMPTASHRPNTTITPPTLADLPAILAFAPEILRVKTVEALEKHFFHNPYIRPEEFFVQRSQLNGAPLGVAVQITDTSFADPEKIDPDMPCFRLGAFGTEGMTHKRVRGLFSFLAKQDKGFFGVGLDLFSHSAYRVCEHDDTITFAAQAPSDAPLLLSFYDRNFRRQGSFPVYERSLT